MAKITKAHCNDCLGERNHEILYSYEHDWQDEQYGVDGSDRYELLKCSGCERITLRHTSWFSENYDQRGQLIPTILYFPPAISRPRPNWFNDLDSITDSSYIESILKEIYVGLQNGTVSLATMGIRALLEFIMIHKVGDNGTFRKNLDEFHNQGYISEEQKKILNAVLETGHAAMHRSYVPSQEDLITCMDITESIIATIYIHPMKVKKLTKKIPKRK